MDAVTSSVTVGEGSSPSPAPKSTSATPSPRSVPVEPQRSSRDVAGELRRGTFSRSSPAEEQMADALGEYTPEAQDEGGDPEELDQPNPEVQEESSEDDLSWAENFRNLRDIHGMPAHELLAALAAGTLPDSLYDKLKIKLKDGDKEWDGTINDARNGAMMRSKFSQSMNELAQERQTFAQEKGNWDAERGDFVNYLKGWKEDPSGKNLLRGARRMGFPVVEMAKLVAQEMQLLESMPPEMREVYEQKQQYEAELERLKHENGRIQRQQQAHQEQQQKQSSEAETENYKKFIQHHGGEAFKSAGLGLTKGSWNLFVQHLTAMSHATQITPELIREAVLAAKEQINEYVGGHVTEAKGPASALPTPKSVANVDPGRPKPSASQKKNLSGPALRNALRNGNFGR